MIQRRGRTWWLDTWVGHGKTRRRVRRSLKTDERALALERARDLAAELQRTRPSGVPFPEFRERYLEWARKTKPASVRNEICHLRRFSSWLETKRVSALEEISVARLEEFRGWVLSQGIGGTDRKAGRATANRYLATIRTLFNKAADWGVVSGSNPVSKVKFFREGGKVRPLSEKEISAVIEAAGEISASKDTSKTGRALYDLCRLVLNTGLRRSEALHLRWSDVINDELRVRGKGSKVRMVPLNAAALHILRARPRVDAFVFDVPNRDQPGVLRRVSETIERKTGIGFNIHLLRHAFASRLLEAGVDVVTISQLLGHSAYMTTLLYSHSNPRLMRRAVATLPRHRHKD